MQGLSMTAKDAVIDLLKLRRRELTQTVRELMGLDQDSKDAFCLLDDLRRERDEIQTTLQRGTSRDLRVRLQRRLACLEQREARYECDYLTLEEAYSSVFSRYLDLIERHNQLLDDLCRL